MKKANIIIQMTIEYNENQYEDMKNIQINHVKEEFEEDFSAENTGLIVGHDFQYDIISAKVEVGE